MNIRSEVKKAFFAYHRDDGTNQHYFSGQYDPESEEDFLSDKKFIQRCLRCGRSRYEVRYDELPAECSWISPDVEEILAKEEEKFFSTVKKGEQFVPDFIARHGFTADTLATLYHTHGYDIEIVSSLLDQEFSQEIKDGYDQKMKDHSNVSKNNKFKKKYEYN